MMTNATRRKVIVSFALFGAAVDAWYGARLAREFADPGLGDRIREVVVSGMALQFSWAALLLWLARHPFRGRFLLLFTGGSMWVGNALATVSLWRFGHGSPGAVVISLMVGTAIAGLFAVAYVVGEPRPEGRPPGCTSFRTVGDRSPRKSGVI